MPPGTWGRGMLQVFFGDDEHTAVEGPYKRLLKVRKWLYLTSCFTVVLAFELYDAAAADALFEVISVPIWLLQQFTIAALAYLTFQYLLLLFQLSVTYDIVLGARFTFRQADEAANAAERFRSAEERLAAARDKVRPARVKEVSEVSRRVSSERQALEASRHMLAMLEDRARLLALESDPVVIESTQNELRQARQDVSAAEKRVAATQQRLRAVKRGRVPDESSDQDAAERELWAAEMAFNALQRRDPARRAGYRVAEIALDGIRIVPPLVVAAISGWRLLQQT